MTSIISVTRVVGGSKALNLDGTLKNPSLASSPSVAIVSQYAYLSAGSTAPWSPSGIVVTFNNQVLSTGSFVSSTQGLVNGDTRSLGGCYQIPISLVHFAQRNPGNPPNPGLNTVVVTLTSAVPNRPNSGNDTNGIQYGATALSFKAMAPIIMVHGWKSGPWWWDDSPPANCVTTDQNFLKNATTNKGGFGFVDPFVSGQYPFDCSVKVVNTLNVPLGAAALEQQLLTCNQTPTLLVGPIPNSNLVCPDGNPATGKLAEFGAKHAHLVVHSLGGLWTRQLIDSVRNQTDPNANDLFGVYSLTTLETPHLGSSLADLLVAGKTVPLLQLLGVVSLDQRIIATFFSGRAGADDLQVGVATALNKRWGSPPQTFTVDAIPNNAAYYSIGSDADYSNNLKIDGATNLINPNYSDGRPDEGYPPPAGFAGLAPTIVQNQRFQWLGTEKNANVLALKFRGRTILAIAADFTGTSSFQLNDITVTVASALGGTGFQQPTQAQTCNSLPCRLFNHTTAGSSMSWNQTAQQALGFILQAQPLQ